MSYPDTRLFIANAWHDAVDCRSLPVLNPATGLNIGRVACAAIADLDRALAAAQSGFELWRDVPALERTRTMRIAAALMRERSEVISTLLTLEQGKPLMEAKSEVLAAADTVEWFAEESQRVYGRIVPPRNLRVRQLVLKDPVGPVAAFTPWNFPISQVVRKLSASLATGCSILIKAPEETPASPAALVQAFADAGVPAGVIGLVFGDPAEISRHLIASPIIRKVTFTGSTAVGKQLASLAGLHMKRMTMELGGHAPVIVADDADLALAIKATGTAKFRNAGQVCISPTRFLVHEDIRPAFVAGLADHARGLKLGDGLERDTQMGPLANARRVEAMAGLVEDATKRGSRLVTGGQRIDGQGNFFLPTVIDDVPNSSRIFNEEPFGPVVAVSGFSKFEDAIAEANRLPYGLAGYAFTQSLANVHLLTQRMEVGMLWINQPPAAFPEMPFGGLKDSGYGSEGGPEAMEAYLNSRSVSILH